MKHNLIILFLFVTIFLIGCTEDTPLVGKGYQQLSSEKQNLFWECIESNCSNIDATEDYAACNNACLSAAEKSIAKNISSSNQSEDVLVELNQTFCCIDNLH